jgi:putative transposase
VRRLLFQTIHDVALMLDRERSGREASPSDGILNSQTVKAVVAREREYDAAKKTVGRKQHIAVDTDGRLLMINLTTADIADSTGAQAIIGATRRRWPWLKHMFADGAYDRAKLMDKAAYHDFVIMSVAAWSRGPGRCPSCPSADRRGSEARSSRQRARSNLGRPIAWGRNCHRPGRPPAGGGRD